MILAGLLGVCVPCLQAADDVLTAKETLGFVTVLAAPISSFSKVETDNVSSPTEPVAEEDEEVVVNIGSDASSSGTVQIAQNGGYVKVEKLLLADSTTFKAANSSNPSSNAFVWMIAGNSNTYITIGINGSLTGGSLLADVLEFNLSGSNQAITFTVSNELFFKDSVWAKNFTATNLEIGSDYFSFSKGSESTTNAKFQQVGLVTGENPSLSNNLVLSTKS